MASIEAFEDHCWRDVIPAADMKLYSPYARETFVGPSVAFLAIDLYNLVYYGGPGAPVELDPQYPNSCGVYAHRAIEPTKRLFAAVRVAPLFPYSTALRIVVRRTAPLERSQRDAKKSLQTRQTMASTKSSRHCRPTSSSTSSAPAFSREHRSSRI